MLSQYHKKILKIMGIELWRQPTSMPVSVEESKPNSPYHYLLLSGISSEGGVHCLAPCGADPVREQVLFTAIANALNSQGHYQQVTALPVVEEGTCWLFSDEMPEFLRDNGNVVQWPALSALLAEPKSKGALWRRLLESI